MGKIWMPGSGGGTDLDVITAGALDVLAGKITVDAEGEPLVGAMPNNGTQSAALNCGQSKAIPAGYTPGGTVTANSLASQTSGTAATGDVLSGKTAWVNGNKIAGSMANQGAKTSALNCGGSYTIPEGYHNGSGKVTANSLASQTGGATAEDKYVKSGLTYWKDGVKRTGAMSVASVVSFKVAPYSTSQVICTWTNPSKGPYGGFAICAKTGSYPTDIQDSRVYTGPGTNASLNAANSIIIGNLTSGTTYYFRIWAYVGINNDTEYIYSGHAQGTCATAAHGRKVFTSSETWTVPAGIRSIDVHCTSGGGSSGWQSSSDNNGHGIIPYTVGSGGAGGGPTEYKTNIAVTPGEVLNVSVGSAGTQNSQGATGNGYTSGVSRGSGSSYSAIVVSGGALSSINGDNNGSFAPANRIKGFNGGSGGGCGSPATPSTNNYKGGNGGSNGSNGNKTLLYGGSTPTVIEAYIPGSGQGTTTREFGTGTLYSGGGGGGTNYRYAGRAVGGDGGGGGGAYYPYASSSEIIPPEDGVPGTGGGSGGALWNNSVTFNAKGGNGNVIIKW